MANKVKELYGVIINGDKRLKLFIAIGLAAVLLISASEFVPSRSEKTADSSEGESYYEYAAALEKETEELISSMEGAGRCRVMITLKNSSENIYAKNTDESFSSGSNSLKNEYVLYNGQEGEQPVLIKQYLPEVQGVAVVCDGAESKAVCENIIKSISSLYNLPVTKISVTKYKG